MITSEVQNKTQSLRPRVGVAVMIIQNGKILLSKRKSAHGYGFWSVPGGHLEYGESVEECAKRELEEETGLTALDVQLGSWTNNVISEGKHYITLFAFVTEFSGIPINKEPDNCEEWLWFDMHNLPSPIFPTVQTLIEQLINKHSLFYFFDLRA